MKELIYSVNADQETADYILETLNKQGLHAILIESKPHYDIILGEIDSIKKYELKLPHDEFEMADRLLINQLDNGETEHFLNEFSNEELLDLAKPSDKKDRLNYLKAKLILKQRGINEDENNSDLLETPNENNPNEKSLSTTSKILLVLASISGLGFVMTGMGGIVIGLFFRLFKVHDLHGNRHYCFDRSSREFGLVLAIMSTVILIIAMVFLVNPFQ